ncbi:hypothetical protein ACMBCN_00645 [Candidatus Liberibacter asiaticus]|nr:hypothetical protein [Candidatus Liberibacter asiaticus]
MNIASSVIKGLTRVLGPLVGITRPPIEKSNLHNKMTIMIQMIQDVEEEEEEEEEEEDMMSICVCVCVCV